jgi:hypothetical protein
VDPVRFSLQAAIISLNSVNRLISVTVKCCVFFAVRTEILIYYLDELRLQTFKADPLARTQVTASQVTNSSTCSVKQFYNYNRKKC